MNDDGDRKSAEANSWALERTVTVDVQPSASVSAQQPGSESGANPSEQDATVRTAGLEPGTHLGRYLIIECVGEGAMGQVYAAYDPELDRKIALKILSVQGAGSSSDSTTSSPGRRLLREAKALSQLSHPNVVAVYDVGTLGKEVFLAMEFVAGKDLRQWVTEKARGWREVLEVYIQAGRGLAAAHAAGLVHRDFKPHNAILGEDGRVRVLDFGLAVPGHGGRDDKESKSSILDTPLSAHSSQSDAWERLTRTGVVLGTPAYLAPEVILGDGADEKSDQFSFCVSLYQALFGCRPFEGRTLREIEAAIQSGHVAEPSHHRVPGWLRKTVLRGLAADRSKRFPSMDALLEALERRDPASRLRRRFTTAGVAATVLLSLGLGTVQLLNHNQRLCQGSERHLENVWGPARQEAVRQALLATNIPYASDTWTRVKEGLDQYSRQWTAMHTDACQATHVRGEQSGELLDLRMRCLRERLGEVKALVDVLARSDKDAVSKAMPAVGSLVDVSVCADEQALRSATPRPTDPQVLQRVESLEEQLEQARALEHTGRYEEGFQRVEHVEQHALAVGYLPLLAETLLLKGILLADRGKYTDAVAVLEKAELVAAEAGHFQVSALAEVEMVYVVGNYLQRFDEALMRARSAQVILMQAGLFQKRGSRFLTELGMVLYRKGEAKQAIEKQKQALQLCQKATSEEQCAAITLNLGYAYYGAGRYDEGGKHLSQGISLMEKALGPMHPNLAKAMGNYGLLLTDEGKIDEAQRWLERALEVYKHSIEQDNPRFASVLSNLGNVHWWKGEYEVALQYHQRALAIRSNALGPDHPDVATSHQNIGTVMEAQGKPALARENYQRSLDIRTRKLGPDSDLVAWSINNIASTYVAEKKYDLAEANLEKALAIWTKAFGPNHPDLYEPLLSLAKVAQARRDPARARALLLRSLQIQKDSNVQNKFTAESYLELAKALWELPGNRQPAVEHARTAAEIADKLSGNHAPLRKEIADWLEQHKP